ncbi:MAG: hypothetical protein AAFV07_19410 [Bacteroidota bacterium]
MAIHAPSRLLKPALFAFLICTLWAGTGCKSKKKLAAERERIEALEKEAKMKELRADLRGLMDTPVEDMADLESRRDLLNRIEAMNLDDSEIQGLIKEVDQFLKDEQARLLAEQKAAEAAAKEEADNKTRRDVASALDAIAGSASTDDANDRIDRALSMFGSNDTPVLIIINNSGASPDYDRPTTIERYLNYLKDTQRNPNRVESVVLDDRGKVKELVLMRK